MKNDAKVHALLPYKPHFMHELSEWGKYCMYIHLGRDYVLNDRDIIGIFNLETTTITPRGREFLNYAQKNGAVVSLSDELPQSYVLADGAVVDTVYLSELSPAAMRRRAEKMIE